MNVESMSKHKQLGRNYSSNNIGKQEAQTRGTTNHIQFPKHALACKIC